MYHSKKKRLMAAVIAGVLAVLMLMSTVMGAISIASAASKSQLQNQLADIKEQKKEIEAKLKKYQGEQDEYASRIATLNNKIGLTENEIEATEELIDKLDRQIDETTVQLQETEQELEEKIELFETRIRVMYENGETSYLDVLLSSDSFSDMLSNLEIVSRIMESDKEVVEEVKALKLSIEEMKASLESDRAVQSDYKESLENQMEELESDRADVKALLSEVENNIDLAEQTARKMEAEEDEINKEIERLSREEAERAAAAAASHGGSSSSSVHGTGSMLWPCPVYTYISSEYGYRTHPISGKVQSFHKGIDIASPKGNPVLAADSGTVVKSYLSSSYGNYVVISHGNGLMTAYAHMSKRLVSVGDTVSKGQQIGTVGSTGNSTGPHLHFEVYENGSTVNPRNYV